METTHLFVNDYGELLAQVNGYELVIFETDDGYQGEYCAVLTDGERLFYYIDNYGSCSGCDWLISEDDYSSDEKNGKNYKVSYKNALNYCGGIKPKYIVPKDFPLKVINKGECSGFEIIKR